MANRYDRQNLIKGWDQSKLKDASVTIIGADLLGQYTLLPLAALGVGDLRIFGLEQAKRDTFLDFNLAGDVAVELKDKIRKVNPDVNVLGQTSTMVNQGSLYFLEGSKLIVDATNNPISKALVADYCQSNKIPMFSIGCGESFGRLVGNNGEYSDEMLIMPYLKDKVQGSILSLVMGGLVAEEIKKVFMGDDDLLEMPLYYNLTSPNRFSYKRLDEVISEKNEFAGKNVLLIGAGALGNFVGLGLAKLGLRSIDIVDDDIVEDTNLNRQILYYDSVGDYKAEALARKLKKVSKRKTRTKAVVARFSKDSKFEEKYDLIFDCVDNFETRALINDYAVQIGAPLISGGTSFSGGQLAVYVPGKTSTIDYKLKLHEEAALAEQERRQESCVYAPEPSVIMTNQVIGGLMLGEARTVFNPEKYGEPLNGIIRYNIKLGRLGINTISDGGNKI